MPRPLIGIPTKTEWTRQTALPTSSSNTVNIHQIALTTTTPETTSAQQQTGTAQSTLAPTSAPRFGILNSNKINPSDLSPLSEDIFSNFILGHYAFDETHGLSTHIKNLPLFFQNFTNNSILVNRLFPTKETCEGLAAPFITEQTRQDFGSNRTLRKTHRLLADIALAAFSIKRINARVIVTSSPRWLEPNASSERTLLLQITKSLMLLGSSKLAKNLCQVVSSHLKQQNLQEEADKFLALITSTPQTKVSVTKEQRLSTQPIPLSQNISDCFCHDVAPSPTDSTDKLEGAIRIQSLAPGEYRIKLNDTIGTNQSEQTDEMGTKKLRFATKARVRVVVYPEPIDKN